MEGEGQTEGQGEATEEKADPEKEEEDGETVEKAKEGTNILKILFVGMSSFHFETNVLSSNFVKFTNTIFVAII